MKTLQKLTPAQVSHNTLLDFEIKMADREFQHREENTMLMNEAYLKAHPEWPWQTPPFINLVGRRRVCGIRYVVFLLLLLGSLSSYAQLTLSGHTITLQADTMEVRQAFKLLNYIVPKGQKINKVVIKDGKEWYQTRWLVNRMLKRYAYTERNGKVKLVRI